MIITLSDQYKLTSDERNIILEQKRISGKDSKNPGEVTWNSIAFYSNIGQAVEGILRRHIQTTEVEGIQSIIQELKTVHKALTATIQVEVEKAKQVAATNTGKADYSNDVDFS